MQIWGGMLQCSNCVWRKGASKRQEGASVVRRWHSELHDTVNNGSQEGNEYILAPVSVSLQILYPVPAESYPNLINCSWKMVLVPQVSNSMLHAMVIWKVDVADPMQMWINKVSVWHRQTNCEGLRRRECTIEVVCYNVQIVFDRRGRQSGRRGLRWLVVDTRSCRIL